MKRFYKDVTVSPDGDGWRVLLDGRAIMTPAKAPQIVPTRTLAEAMAQEWVDQGEEIDASAFHLRDLADYALDAVAADRDGLVVELAAYAGTDTLCYRADEGDALHARQMEVWEPLLLAAEKRWDVHFERISGVMHRPQSADTLARMKAAVAAQPDFALAALRMLTSLSASLVIALCAIDPDANAEGLWSAANLEEDWQAELWGRDAEAQENSKARFAAFALAIRFARLSLTE